MALFDKSFFQETFMPHGYCLQWRPDILWLNVVSDLFIAAAYFTIPLALILFVRKRKDIQYRGIFFLFASFILLCGITHLMAIYNVWHGAYGLHGIFKALTAIVSIITAIVIFKNIEDAAAMPSRREFERALEASSNAKIKAEKLEIEKKAEEIFKFTTELLPSGLLVIDHHQEIVMVNAALGKIFGYEKDELLGKPLSILVDHDMSHHTILVKKYIGNPEQSHQMAAGRVVRGIRKDGSLVDLQINLSVHSYQGEKHTFATVTDFGFFLSEQEQKNEMSNRLNRAVEASEDGIWEWNVQNEQVWFSSKMLKLIGRNNKTNSSLDDWLDHIHPQDRVKMMSALESHFIEKSKYDLSYRGLTEKNEYEWFRARGDTIFDHNDQPVLMSGILSNINKTKELEDKLAEKSKFLNEVLQRSLTGLYIFNVQTQHITYINPEYTNLTGYSFSDLDDIQQLQGLSVFFHPNEIDRVKLYQSELLKRGHEDGMGIEYRFKHKSGEWKWLYARESVYSLSQDGRPKELLGALFNITELKQRESEIRKLALDYSTTFEQAGVGIAHINIDYSLEKANSKFLEIFSFKAPDKQKLNFLELCEQVDRERLSMLIKKLVETKETIFHTEKRFTRSGGDTFWADLTVSLVNASKGESPAYFIVILDDISERKLMEHNLSESNLALERFAYSASHDLQEPLRKISAFSGALEMRLKNSTKDPEVLFQLERICDASVRMGKMIDNLLKLSRATSVALNIQSISLSSIIIQSLDDISSNNKPNDMSLILKKDVLLAVDSNAFGQVIRNLIGNSIAYRAPERTLNIEIDTQVYEKMIVLKYQDNGQGFPADKAEIIFEPFRRLVGKDTPGTGMGLTICRQVLKAHKGRIYASAIEQGALFVLEIPRVANNDN